MSLFAKKTLALTKYLRSTVLFSNSKCSTVLYSIYNWGHIFAVGFLCLWFHNDNYFQVYSCCDYQIQSHHFKGLLCFKYKLFFIHLSSDAHFGRLPTASYYESCCREHGYVYTPWKPWFRMDACLTVGFVDCMYILFLGFFFFFENYLRCIWLCWFAVWL